MEERQPDAGDHGRHSRRHVLRHLVAGHPAAPGARARARPSSPRSPKRVYGTGGLGHALFIFTQAATMLILVLAANTSFADFPRLASFQAEDSFMPRQLTKRGHRLVFSNGIIALSIAAGGAGHPARRRRHQADPALRHRRVHQLHPLAAGHGPPPPPHQGAEAGGSACSSTVSARRHRRRHHRHRVHQVPRGGLGHHRPHPDPGLGRRPPEPPVRDREATSSRATRSRRPTAPILRRHTVLVLIDQHRPHRRPGHPVRPHPDPRRPAGGAHRHRRGRTPRSWPTSGATWPWPACRSRSVSAPTGASTGRCSSWSPRPRPTGRPRSPSSSLVASTARPGTGCCTTAPPTRSPRRSATSPTPTSRSCRTTSPSRATGQHIHKIEHGAVSGTAGITGNGSRPRHDPRPSGRRHRYRRDALMALFSRATKALEARLAAETERGLRGARPGGPRGCHTDRRRRVAGAGQGRGTGQGPAGAAVVGEDPEPRADPRRRHRRAHRRLPRPPPDRRHQARGPLVVEGTVAETRNQLALLNPAYQLLPHEVALPF